MAVYNQLLFSLGAPDCPVVHRTVSGAPGWLWRRGRSREIADGVPEEGLWDTPTHEEFRGLVLKLESASSEFKTQFTNHTASTTKLENNSSLLKENFYTLQEQYSDLESVDMVDAITSFLYAEYAYNAALKVGNSVLSQSLMDYLN